LEVGGSGLSLTGSEVGFKSEVSFALKATFDCSISIQAFAPGYFCMHSQMSSNAFEFVAAESL
jgi:hypothetical protein